MVSRNVSIIEQTKLHTAKSGDNRYTEKFAKECVKPTDRQTDVHFVMNREPEVYFRKLSSYSSQWFS